MTVLATHRLRAPLDSVAIGMSLVCAVHCAITPLLIVVLPVLATTFWVHQDFHLWMLLLVVPMTLSAVLLGFRKHRDRLVLTLGGLGLAVLVSVAVYESFFVAIGHGGATGCAHCAGSGTGIGVATGAGESAGILGTTALVNMGGAGLLVAAHVRNFLRSRGQRCRPCPTHGEPALV